MKRLASAVIVVLIFQCAWLPQKSPAETGEAADGEIEGVVLEIDRKIKEKRAAPQPEDSDELTGVVIADPRETSPGLSQFRLCTDNKRFVNVCMPSPCSTLKNSGCSSDQRVTISSCKDTLDGCMAASAQSLHKAQPLTNGQASICTLQHAVECGMVSCDGLIGDGTSTAHCEMPCTNKTDQEVTICVPQDQCFQPDHNDCQTMMCTEDTCITLSPHQAVTTTVPTMCISAHSIKPPPEKGSSYQPKPIDDSQFYKFCDHTLTLSRYLEEAHYYDQVPIPAKRRRDTICQLAQWMEQARRSGDPKDAISPKSILTDLLDKGHFDPAKLSPEVLAKLDDRCQSLYKAANLTYKLAKDKRMDALIAGTDVANIR